MTHPRDHRVLVSVPLDELMGLLELDGSLVGVDVQPVRDRLLLVVQHPAFDPVAPECEPPIVTRDAVRVVTTTTEVTTDPHMADLVLARTAITPGRRYFTCARFGHSIDPRDFVHTTGPCPDDQTPSTTLPASSESHA